MSELIVDALSTSALGPISFTVAAGERLFLSGASGAGKSLCLRAIADLDPHDGEVRLDGLSQRQMSAPLWRRRVAMLPAEPRWWFETVGEHFPQADATAFRALGFDVSVLSGSLSRCSTGERQRLALLRLLQYQPRCLLLDEPTASLDPASVTRVERLICEWQQASQAAVVWVSHDAAQQRRLAHRAVVLAHGRQLAA